MNQHEMAQKRAEARIGNQYGRLTLIAVAGWGKRGKLLYEVRCSCEKRIVKVVAWDSLRRGVTISCGCWNREKVRERQIKPDGEAAFIQVFHAYKGRAKNSGLSFFLDKYAFKALVTQPCFYCRSSGTNTFRSDSGNFDYNGLDRVDSTKGYEPDNVVSCCFKPCNYAKSDMTQSDFFAWVEQVHFVRHERLRSDPELYFPELTEWTAA